MTEWTAGEKNPKHYAQFVLRMYFWTEHTSDGIQSKGYMDCWGSRQRSRAADLLVATQQSRLREISESCDCTVWNMASDWLAHQVNTGMEYSTLALKFFPLEGHALLPVTFHWPKLVTWPHLISRVTGGCSQGEGTVWNQGATPAGAYFMGKMVNSSTTRISPGIVKNRENTPCISFFREKIKTLVSKVTFLDLRDWLIFI